VARERSRNETPKGYYTHVVTDNALDWLKSRAAVTDAAKPWALCIGHKAPHSFYFPEEKYKNAFDHVHVPYPASAFAFDGKPDWIRQRLTTWHGIYGPLFEWRKNFPDTRPEAVADFQNMVRAYWGTILSVDDSAGRLVAFLKSSGQFDNTIIVFMGDNGLLDGEHGMVDKRTMHEPSIRIPLIARGPGLPVGRTIEGQVLAMDLAPSLLDLCGAPVISDVQGKSWKALANGRDPAWRTAGFTNITTRNRFPIRPTSVASHRRMEIHALPTRRWLARQTSPRTLQSERRSEGAAQPRRRSEICGQAPRTGEPACHDARRRGPHAREGQDAAG
jgi:arylsulfatase A-like enzyme